MERSTEDGDDRRTQRGTERQPVSKAGVATALVAGAGLVFAGLNEIVKRTGSLSRSPSLSRARSHSLSHTHSRRTGDAATVEAPKTWSEFSDKLAPLIEHIVFDKYLLRPIYSPLSLPALSFT